jgi:transposase
MLTIGVDAHKQVHAAVALDERGQEIGHWRGATSLAGWQAVAAWAAGLGEACRWGIEGAWGNGRGLAQHLVATDAEVYEINPRWTAAGRRGARDRGKNDRLDARAVALLVWREATTLPVVGAEDETAVLDLLVAEREALVAEATRTRNQVHQLLQQIEPEYAARLPRLRSQAGVRALEAYATADARPLQQHRAAAVRRLAQRLRLLAEQIKLLVGQIRALAAPRFTPLTAICGVDLLTAAALAGILGPGRRFATDAQLAAYAGAAPLEASSAGRTRHRLNRGGNRQLNAILYRIAVTQARCSPQARAYLERRTSEGKTRREAVRALKRFLARAIWRKWEACRDTPAAQPPAPVVLAA